MSDVIERLQSVVDKVTGNAPSDVHLGMRVPADPDRDLDLIAADAIKEIERLKAVNERDRYTVAHGVGQILNALKAHEWLRLGQGSYEWNDDRWKDEFGRAFDAVVDALEPLEKVMRDHTDCPVEFNAIMAARRRSNGSDIRGEK